MKFQIHIPSPPENDSFEQDGGLKERLQQVSDRGLHEQILHGRPRQKHGQELGVVTQTVAEPMRCRGFVLEMGQYFKISFRQIIYFLNSQVNNGRAGEGAKYDV